jgi:hydroxypyruvate reductase
LTQGALRAHVDAIVHATLAAVDARLLVRAALQVEGSHLTCGPLAGDETRLAVASLTLDLDAFERVLVVGAGKASVPMARGAIHALGERILGGVVVTKAHDVGAVGPVAVLRGGHPLPDAASVEAARRLRACVTEAGERDLVLVLVSGGASALACAPVVGVSLDDVRATTAALMAAGAEIGESNTVRKHLDLLKGGGLARAASPATLLALVLSDVPNDNLAVIGSGPTVPDPSTFDDARRALDRYGLWKHVPSAVRQHLERGERGEVEETPKPGEACFLRTYASIVGANRDAVRGALHAAHELGYDIDAGLLALTGDAREVGRSYGEYLRKLAAGAPPFAYVIGGETTVTLRGDGIGGRTLELALSAAPAIDGVPAVALLALATDGEDGPSGAAGAIVTSETVARARALGLDLQAALARNDTLPVFQALGDLIVTGPTGTNVGDVIVLLTGAPTA